MQQPTDGCGRACLTCGYCSWLTSNHTRIGVRRRRLHEHREAEDGCADLAVHREVATISEAMLLIVDAVTTGPPWTCACGVEFRLLVQRRVTRKNARRRATKMNQIADERDGLAHAETINLY